MVNIAYYCSKYDLLINLYPTSCFQPISFETDTFKTGGSPGIWTQDLTHSNSWSPIARHACDAARWAFPCPYRPTSDNVVGTIFFMLYSEIWWDLVVLGLRYHQSGWLWTIFQLLSVRRILDEMFLILKFSYQTLWHDYLIVKFFVQRQYGGIEKLSKVTPFDGIYFEYRQLNKIMAYLTFHKLLILVHGSGLEIRGVLRESI